MYTYRRIYICIFIHTCIHIGVYIYIHTHRGISLEPTGDSKGVVFLVRDAPGTRRGVGGGRGGGGGDEVKGKVLSRTRELSHELSHELVQASQSPTNSSTNIPLSHELSHELVLAAGRSVLAHSLIEVWATGQARFFLNLYFDFCLFVVFSHSLIEVRDWAVLGRFFLFFFRLFAHSLIEVCAIGQSLEELIASVQRQVCPK
jgi:hypothetical protein